MTLGSAIRNLSSLLLGWLSARRRDRRDVQLLGHLDARMLRDLGLERDESTQGFWR